MGQQQLQLLTLTAIIISLAIVVAIQAFHSASLKANEDAVYQDLLVMVTKIEGCFHKATILGGVAPSKNLEGITSFHQLGYYEHDDEGNIVIPGSTFQNRNGRYRMISGDTLVIEAEPSERPQCRIICRCVLPTGSKKLQYTLEQAFLSQ